MIKSVEINFNFNSVNNDFTVETPNISIVEELQDWMEQKDSPMAYRVSMGVCTITGVILVGQVLRFLLL